MGGARTSVRSGVEAEEMFDFARAPKRGGVAADRNVRAPGGRGNLEPRMRADGHGNNGGIDFLEFIILPPIILSKKCTAEAGRAQRPKP